VIPGIVLILALGLPAGRLFERLGLPGLLGMILTGIVVGPSVLDLLAPDLLLLAGDIRMLALVIILLRAGLGLERELLARVGTTALKMGALPALFEGTAIMLVAHWALALPLPEAGMLGFILAAATPAVIVPLMLALQARGMGMGKGIPIIVLAGASIDDVFAITLFGIFAGVWSQGSADIGLSLVRIPLEITGGLALGIAAGMLLSAVYRHQSVSLSRAERLALLAVAALGVVLLGQWLGLAGLLGVMTCGFVLRQRAAGDARELDTSLDALWTVAGVFLFVLIGAEVDLSAALAAGGMGMALVAVGLLARTGGVMVSLWRSPLTLRERLFSAVAYTPKATVQAATGGLPLAMGVASGPFILAVAVLAIVVTASAGATGIRVLGERWLTPNTAPSPGRPERGTLQ
jgi:solute carrier family 9B (sodium/hydrogen exchanger), member 1/2